MVFEANRQGCDPGRVIAGCDTRCDKLLNVIHHFQHLPVPLAAALPDAVFEVWLCHGPAPFWFGGSTTGSLSHQRLGGLSLSADDELTMSPTRHSCKGLNDFFEPDESMMELNGTVAMVMMPRVPGLAPGRPLAGGKLSFALHNQPSAAIIAGPGTAGARRQTGADGDQAA